MSDVVKKDAKLPSQQTQPDYRRVPQTYHDGKSPAAWAGAMGRAAHAANAMAFVILALSGVATLVLRGLGYGEAVGYDGRPRS